MILFSKPNRCCYHLEFVAFIWNAHQKVHLKLIVFWVFHPIWNNYFGLWRCGLDFRSKEGDCEYEWMEKGINLLQLNMLVKIRRRFIEIGLYSLMPRSGALLETMACGRKNNLPNNTKQTFFGKISLLFLRRVFSLTGYLYSSMLTSRLKGQLLFSNIITLYLLFQSNKNKIRKNSCTRPWTSMYFYNLMTPVSVCKSSHIFLTNLLNQLMFIYRADWMSQSLILPFVPHHASTTSAYVQIEYPLTFASQHLIHNP